MEYIYIEIFQLIEIKVLIFMINKKDINKHKNLMKNSKYLYLKIYHLLSYNQEMQQQKKLKLQKRIKLEKDEKRMDEI